MLTTEPLFVEGGVPVFKDHSDPNQFWYLPARVALARRDDNGRAIFSFISYRNPEGKGGGFLSFQVELGLSDAARSRILGMLSAWSAKPRLAQVPFTEGTVKAIALDAQSVEGGGTGSSGLVTQVLGTAKPALFGDNAAIFTLVLDPVGAQVVETSIKGGQALLGVMYELQYMAMQPPLNVKVEADMKKVYTFVSAAVKAQYRFIKADLAATLEKLRASKVIKITRTDTEGTEASGKELDAAMERFTNMLAQDWFNAELTPGTTKVTPANPESPTRDTSSGKDPLNAGL